MATSQQGQNAVVCQLCEETFEVKWKCLTCQFFMCKRCCNIHEKFKSSDQHEIVDIRDFSVIQEVKKDFSDIKCEIHTGQRYCLFCQKCEELVCTSCVTKTHNTHKMLELSEGKALMLDKLAKRKTEIENENKNKAKCTKFLLSFRESENSIYEQEKKKIHEHGKVLQNTVDEQIRKLLDELDKNWKEQNICLSKEESKLEFERQETEKRMEKLISTIKSELPGDVIENFKREKERAIEQAASPKFPKVLPRFEVGKVVTSEIISACGCFRDCYSGETNKRLIFVIDHELKSSEDGAVDNTCILLNDDESAWVNDRNSKCLTKVNLSSTGQIGETQNTVDVKIFDMAKTEDGSILLSTEKSELRILSKTTGKIRKSCFRVEEGLYTTAVHITRNGNILVGAKSKSTNNSWSYRQRSLIEMMNKYGKVERTFEFDENKQKLFSFPQRITSNDSKNIYVIDILSTETGSGRILILSDDGQVRGIYSGHQTLNVECPFKPVDAISTKFGSVIVSDKSNHMLHILNTEGKCIQYQNTRDLRIFNPFAMDINEDVLLISSESNERQGKNILSIINCRDIYGHSVL